MLLLLRHLQGSIHLRLLLAHHGAAHLLEPALCTQDIAPLVGDGVPAGHDTAFRRLDVILAGRRSGDGHAGECLGDALDLALGGLRVKALRRLPARLEIASGMGDGVPPLVACFLAEPQTLGRRLELLHRKIQDPLCLARLFPSRVGEASDPLHELDDGTVELLQCTTALLQHGLRPLREGGQSPVRALPALLAGRRAFGAPGV